MAGPTLFDEASLALIASGGAGKDGKVYSVKPTDGSGDFTFTRGSNLSATRVNASQLIEKGRENVLFYSNDFSRANWTKAGSVLTSGQTGYDGTNDAWLLEKNSANGNIYQPISLSGIASLSFYAKANTTDWIRVRNGSGYVYFDVANGVVGGNINAVNASIISIGNGWYRVKVSWSGTITIAQIYVADSDGSISGSSGSVYIQDSQLEQGLVATDYIETGASTAQAGILENTPRLDYSGGATCPSLLLEPSRTNIFAQSEYFTGGDWDLNAGTTLTDNYATSPEGVQNATRYVGTGASGLGDKYTLVNGTQYTISAYVKSNTGATQYCRLIGDSSNISSDLEVTTEWTRIDYTWTSGGLTNKTNGIFRDSSNNDIDILIFALQLEAGSYATSYIPTYGVSQTRAQDDCRESSATSLIGQPEGTIYWEGSIVSVSSQGANIASFNYSTGSSVSLERQPNGTIRGRIWSGGAVVNIVTSSSSYDGNVKIAFAYKSGDTTLYINGLQIGTSSTAFTFGSALTEFNLGAGDVYFAYPHKSEVKEALLFKTRLSNEELATLTT